MSLVGLPGSGKSTVGRQLARRLGWRFVDADAEIEKRIGCSIREFFDREGEPRFREIEEQVIGRLTDGTETVIATGGGAVLRPANRRALRDRSTVIYLRSSPDALYRRLRHDVHRPLLQVADPLRRMRQLHSERDALYRETAHFVIESGRPAVSNLVGLVLMQLELAGVLDPMTVPSTVGSPARER